MPNSQTNQDVSSCDLLNYYTPLSGVFDEMMTTNGEVRPIWRNFINHLCSISPEEMKRKTLRGNQYLDDAGVFYRQYGESGTQERDWPLSHIPVLVAEGEWKNICEGLSQRADLLEEVLNDVYGDNTLVRDGILPPNLIASNPEWLRPMVGSKPRGGHHLHFLAFEIGRGPAGNWWVLGDRAQAPSGAGFALENRVATSRVFSDYFETENVERLAGFFREFRQALINLSDNSDHILGILTPGRMTDTYFEHAYIARYLGLTLLEGEDMTVENGEVMVRTVRGLKPISVLWRRLDSLFADPLELDENSQLGTAGLAAAARNGKVSLVNALGSGIVETRALLAFMPRISKKLRNEPLKMPNIATWWCGQKAERQHVSANAKNMLIGSAMTTNLPFSLDLKKAIGELTTNTSSSTLESLLESEGEHLVGQEAVTLSTTPVLQDGKLTPRPVTLRVFACRTADGWQFMPGGYARIGRDNNASAITLQQGGSVSDVWIVTDQKVEKESLIGKTGSAKHQERTRNLPSRAADNLFWLGRYAERAEIMMRMLRAYHSRFAEYADPERPLLKLLENNLTTIGVSAHYDPLTKIIEVINSALNSAAQLRDRFSDDGWLALKNLLKEATSMQTSAPSSGDELARSMNILIQKITAFSGLIHENMYRFTGWRFLSIGRSLERALETSSLLMNFSQPDMPAGSLDLALELADSSMSHRHLFTVETQRDSVLNLVALDELNPRSIAYQMLEIKNQISYLPSSVFDSKASKLSKVVKQSYSDVKALKPETIVNEDFADLKTKISSISSLLAHVYFN